MDAGDRPEFSFYVPGRGGNLRLAVMRGDQAIWLDEAAVIESLRAERPDLRYEPWQELQSTVKDLTGSFDVIVSNCVINLCMDKLAVLKGAYRLLKPGGELYFADVYCDRRLPDAVRADPLLYGECLGGALYWNDFLPMAKQAGFLDPRLVTSRPIEIGNPEMREKLGRARFFSATYRLFKLEDLEPACEDYGQAVIYRGGIAEEPDAFLLDGHHLIERGKVFPVCGNVWRMLADTRFSPYFGFVGDFSTHYGIFEGCGTPVPFEDASKDGNRPASCC